jgi:tetratricopeptide (TPR) repeat protein
MQRAFALLLLCSAVAFASTSPRITESEGPRTPSQVAQQQQRQDDSLSVQNWRQAPPPPWDATPAELEAKGDELLRMRALPDALDYFRAALDKTAKKDRAVLYNKCGITELHLMQLDDAQRDFVNSIKRNKQYAGAINNLGVTYFLKRNYKKAAKIYKKAIEVDPNSASFHSNLGRAYFAMKKQDLAAQEYSRALEIDPDIFSRETRGGIIARMPQEKGLLSYVLAKLLASHGKTEEALVYLRRAIDEGYKGIDKAYSDPEFAKLLTDQRFIDLMSARNNPAALPPR